MKIRKREFPLAAVRAAYRVYSGSHELNNLTRNAADALSWLPNEGRANKINELLWELSLALERRGYLFERIFLRYTRMMFNYGFIPVSCREKQA
jgi:hypothetical protein